MSTFNGIVSEFPDIRIDFFWRNAGAQPPLACFLSHVHSDHLAGIESLRSPLYISKLGLSNSTNCRSSVYCSAATKEILLRLERYPCRINYAKGVLESTQQTFKHLRKVLKPLPLETPTSIELRPGREIQVTLFDANHCPGAVMFLVEGDNKAILYTGDIRSEPWFVNAISRNPNLIEYTSGIKTLDKIYLDTSFTENVPFQTKAQGIAELLRKVSQYPSDTIFHLQAWTYGYEDVWLALSKALKSKIHVDDYKLRIYGSLKSNTPDSRFDTDTHLTPESPALTGHMCGNMPHPGCLTSDVNVRLHSCEKGNLCEVAQRPTTISIQPIVAHLPTGEDLAEVGVGGGGDDLQREAELEFLDQASLATLFNTFLSSSIASTDMSDILEGTLEKIVSTGRNIPLDWGIGTLNAHSAEEVIMMLVERLRKNPKNQKQRDKCSLPRTIYFPYSRHSSLPELCHFVEAFRPLDVWPCTVNNAEWLKNGVTIGGMFGPSCSGELFEHDLLMQDFAAKHTSDDGHQQHGSQTTIGPDSVPSSPVRESQGASQKRPVNIDHRFVSPLLETQASIRHGRVVSEAECPKEHLEAPPENSTQQSLVVPTIEQAEDVQQENPIHPESLIDSPSNSPAPVSCRRKRPVSDISVGENGGNRRQMRQITEESLPLGLSDEASIARRDAYWHMVDYIDKGTWGTFQLISTSNEYTVNEPEL
ncbi:hypothetical protein BFJ66_g2568 [Fusarium oxysporum f. sp. cepae]|uniref:Protein artemis n=1 Tax=Fusarium oxysporum f. sp. cepae TaxID=396571 RepID=A0A3L6NHG1_FUSOX|nr:hypothetical protein BFJ65_g7982 [Fusarium oxysporum f. sp. cepae]RKK58933.1 hypothetical protein BFJ66_g2568 [Fusarium oxysporum f. sp. cepae]